MALLLPGCAQSQQLRFGRRVTISKSELLILSNYSLPRFLQNAFDLIRRVLFLARPYGRHVGPSGFRYNGKQDKAFVVALSDF